MIRRMSYTVEETALRQNHRLDESNCGLETPKGIYRDFEVAVFLQRI